MTDYQSNFTFASTTCAEVGAEIIRSHTFQDCCKHNARLVTNEGPNIIMSITTFPGDWSGLGEQNKQVYLAQKLGDKAKAKGYDSNILISPIEEDTDQVCFDTVVFER